MVSSADSHAPGDPDALDQALTQALADHRVKVQVQQQGSSLQIALVSSQRLEPDQVMPIVRAELESWARTASLDNAWLDNAWLDNALTVEILSRRTERVTVDWRDRITLDPAPSSPGTLHSPRQPASPAASPDDASLEAELELFNNLVTPQRPPDKGSSASSRPTSRDLSSRQVSSKPASPSASPPNPPASSSQDWQRMSPPSPPSKAAGATQSGAAPPRASRSESNNLGLNNLSEPNLAALVHLVPLLSYTMIGLGWLGGSVVSSLFSAFFIWRWVPPLVLLLVKGNQSPYLKKQAKEILNFQITMMLIWIGTLVLMVVLIGFLLVPLVLMLDLVSMAIAAARTASGQPFRYPICFRFVR